MESIVMKDKNKIEPESMFEKPKKPANPKKTTETASNLQTENKYQALTIKNDEELAAELTQETLARQNECKIWGNNQWKNR